MNQRRHRNEGQERRKGVRRKRENKRREMWEIKCEKRGGGKGKVAEKWS